MMNTIKKSLGSKKMNLLLFFDKFYYARKQFKAVFAREMNLDSPRNLIEKFYWIEKNADLSLMTKCTDKYAVRDFVRERGCGEILNELYAKWDTPEEIDLALLPDSFVLKINNGSGDVTIVKDKSAIDEEQIKSHFKELYKIKYGKYNGQLHYLGIKPCIIAEKLLPIDNIPYSCSILDYKIWCFNGNPDCIWVAYDRGSGVVKMALYDLEWNPIPQHLKSISHYQYQPNLNLPKPSALNQMLEYASILSKGFPEVRVDLYEVDGKVVFGEMTFSSGYGYFSDAFYDYLGSKTDLSIVHKQESC